MWLGCWFAFTNFFAAAIIAQQEEQSLLLVVTPQDEIENQTLHLLKQTKALILYDDEDDDHDFLPSLPPSMMEVVHDLRLVNRTCDYEPNKKPTSKFTTCHLVLKWTSPGYDLVEATEYDLRFSMDYNNFTEDFLSGTRLNFSQHPLPPGQIEYRGSIIRKIPFDKDIYFALKWVDGKQNWSQTSRILAVRIESPSVPEPNLSTIAAGTIVTTILGFLLISITVGLVSYGVYNKYVRGRPFFFNIIR